MAPFESVVRGLEERRRELEDNFREVYPNVDIDSLAPGAVVLVPDNPDGGKWSLLAVPVVNIGENDMQVDLRMVGDPNWGRLFLRVDALGEVRSCWIEADSLYTCEAINCDRDINLLRECLSLVEVRAGEVEVEPLFEMFVRPEVDGMSGGVYWMYPAGEMTGALDFFNLVNKLAGAELLCANSCVSFEWSNKDGR